MSKYYKSISLREEVIKDIKAFAKKYQEYDITLTECLQIAMRYMADKIGELEIKGMIKDIRSEKNDNN